MMHGVLCLGFGCSKVFSDEVLQVYRVQILMSKLIESVFFLNVTA